MTITKEEYNALKSVLKEGYKTLEQAEMFCSAYPEVKNFRNNLGILDTMIKEYKEKNAPLKP